MLSEPTILNNKYQIISVIQSGTFSTVYLAEDLINNHQKVAVKSIPFTKSNKGLINHEVDILNRIKSIENVCHLLDHFKLEKTYYLIFEYCEYGDLYDFLNNNANNYNLPKPYDNSVLFTQFAISLMQTIKELHDLGIYHRDLKPENIFITKDLTIKIGDFGLSSIKKYSNDYRVGTNKYMAPEVYNNEENHYYDCEKSDIWSLGITLLYVLFGFTPFNEPSIENNDYWFKKYTESSDLNLFFDIYPNLATNGFDYLIKPLLSFKPEERDLKQCLEDLSDLQNNNELKVFTVDEEIELEKYFNSNKEFIESEQQQEYISNDDDEFEILEFDNEFDVPELDYSSKSPSISINASSSHNSSNTNIPPSLVESYSFKSPETFDINESELISTFSKKMIINSNNIKPKSKLNIVQSNYNNNITTTTTDSKSYWW